MMSLLAAIVFSSAAFANSPLSASVPKVFLEYWNSDSDLQYNNNCYNYATNRVTNSFAQPGEASDKMYQEISCEEVHRAASSDLGLTPSEFFPYEKKEDQTLIALVVSPDYDYHWYRRDDDGLWTHKMGGTPATTVDNSDKPIESPETADRGSYTEFCGYFRVTSYVTEEHEQNGGQVRIGDMTELPGEVSEVQLLLYSGRRNPSFKLDELITKSNLKDAFADIKVELSQLKNVSFMNKTDLHPHLGYQGVQIIDRQGLLAKKNSMIRFREGKVFIYSPGVSQPLVVQSEAFRKLEKELLKLR